MKFPEPASGFLTAEILSRHLELLFPGVSEYKLDAGDVPKPKGASINLRLGKDCFVTSDPKPIRLSEEEPYLTSPQGAFAILTTWEKVAIPTNVLGFITMRLSVKSQGLINVSGFHVDPGFEGTLSYSVFNAGPNDITVRLKDPVFTIFYAMLSEETKEYDGPYQNQTGLQSAQIASLAGSPTNLVRLERQLNFLQTQLRLAAAVALGLAVPLALLIIEKL